MNMGWDCIVQCYSTNDHGVGCGTVGYYTQMTMVWDVVQCDTTYDNGVGCSSV